MLKRSKEQNIDGDIVHLAQQLGLKNYAVELCQGYEEIFNNSKGGYLRRAKNHSLGLKKIEIEKEETMGKILASRGKQVYLLPESTIEGIKNPDAIVDNEVWELKKLTTMNENTINKTLHNATKQAPNVFLSLADEVPIEIITRRLKGEANRLDSKLVRVGIYWQQNHYQSSKAQLLKEDVRIGE